MKLTYRSQTFFPFRVPEMDASFAASVGPQTVYPVGLDLDEALQIYWRAQNYHVTATASGVLGPLTQALIVDDDLPPRSARVGTFIYYGVDGFTPTGPGDFAVGWGVRAVMPGAGTVIAAGEGVSGTNAGAVLNLLVDLFYPEFFAPDPIVKYDGKWWPAMSVSCAVANDVALDGGGVLSMPFECSTHDPGDSIEIGTFTFFGQSVPVFCADLAPAAGSDPAETRTFSGALTVANEFV